LRSEACNRLFSSNFDLTAIAKQPKIEQIYHEAYAMALAGQRIEIDAISFLQDLKSLRISYCHGP
jgi:hypothetical protein